MTFPLFIVAGLDHRFGWSPMFPVWLNILGLAMVGIGYAFAVWALAENPFFSAMVRIQADRGHIVPIVTPFNQAGELDVQALWPRRYIFISNAMASATFRARRITPRLRARSSAGTAP